MQAALLVASVMMVVISAGVKKEEDVRAVVRWGGCETSRCLMKMEEKRARKVCS